MRSEGFLILALLFLIASCNEQSDNTSRTDREELVNVRDTVYSDVIAKEIRASLFDEKRNLEVSFFELEGPEIYKLRAGDTFEIKANYRSSLYPRLNKSAFIRVVPVKSLKVIRYIDLNTTEVYIMPQADTIEFSLMLQSKEYTLMESYVGSSKKIKHREVNELGLAGFIELVK